MSNHSMSCRWTAALISLASVAVARPALAQDAAKTTQPTQTAKEDRFGSRPVLTPAQWQKLDPAVDRALAYIAKKQSSDGSFPTDVSGQPAVTALCVMAFL